MIKRTIEISSNPAHLMTRHGQLILRRDGETVGQIPCEDLGVVVVDHPSTTYSHAALTSLLDAKATVILCGPDHLPKGLFLPLAENSQVVQRINAQIAASRPLKKRLWTQIIVAKIRAQADNLVDDSSEQRRLLQFAREVKSGDSTNREAQASKVYWSAWLTNADGESGESLFRRRREGDSPNSLLNYGYAIVRAAVARAIISAGLLPAIGLHHTNRANAFCLADDLIEPLRPMVDETVRSLYWSGQTQIDRETKQALLELLTVEMQAGGQSGPLMVGLHRYAASLVRCFQGDSDQLEIPTPCNSTATAVCGS